MSERFTPKHNAILSRWFATAEKCVGSDRIGPIWVSTIFLGVNISRGSDPIFFETIVFRGGKGAEQFRYGSWQEAEEGHKAAVERVRAEILERARE